MTGAVQNTGHTIKVTGGNFVVDGGSVSLTGLMSILMSDRIDNLNGAVGGYVQEMEKQNEEAKQCNEWLADLRALRPEGQKDKVSSGDDGTSKTYGHITNLFRHKYGYNPEDRFGTRQFLESKGVGGSSWSYKFTQADMDQMIETVKSHQSTLSSNQQMVQLRLEKLSHALSEAQELEASLEKDSYNAKQQVISKI